MRVGFAGLGAIGRPMAAQFVAEHELTVWNRTAATAEAFAAKYGVRSVPTARELAERSDVVISCLPASGEVAALVAGDDGLLAGMHRGALMIDCTSGDPITTRETAGHLATKNVAFADAPVSGGTAGAEAGTLTAMVGASSEVFERARAVLETFCATIIHVGPVGAGHALKAISNAILATNIIAIGEGLTAAVRAGVPASTALDVINASNARSYASLELVPARALTRAWPKTFRLALLDKDTRERPRCSRRRGTARTGVTEYRQGVGGGSSRPWGRRRPRRGHQTGRGGCWRRIEEVTRDRSSR